MDYKYLNQHLRDKISPFPTYRWAVTGVLALLYVIRLINIKSHAVITYCALVYLLHAFILFATPKDNSIPSPFENSTNEEEDNYIPSNIDNDFKPYVRRLPEYDFWVFTSEIVGVSYFLTFFSFTSIPVFVPILIIYFVFILLMTFWKLYKHSRKFQYNIFMSLSSKKALDQ